MTTDVLAPPEPTTEHRPGPARLITVLTGHALVSFLRTPAAAFFTLVFPVSFLVIVGAIVGGQEAADGVRISQFLVAPFAVFGVAEGSFCVLAISFATLRDSGVLRRLRGSPAPAGAVLASRIVAAMVMSLASVALLVLVGVLGYGVRPLWSKAPAAAVTVVVGIVCCAALGMAVVALSRSVLRAQALTNGILIPLAFISNVFIVDADLPAALDWLSRCLPLRHFADALAGTFDPFIAGNGFAWGNLAVMTAWAAVGIAIAVWRFTWEPRIERERRTRTKPPTSNEPRGEHAAGNAASVGPSTTAMPLHPGRPGAVRLVLGQARHALHGLSRERLPVFFAVVFPVVLLLLFPLVLPEISVHGISLEEALLPGMVAYAIAVAGYVNMPEEVAGARAAGVLKRLRATPVPPWAYLAGRLVSVVLVAAAATVVLVSTSVLVNGHEVDPARLPAAMLGVLAAGVCFGAVGLMLLTFLPRARSVTAITLGTLVPLSFVSDVFFIGGELPRQLQLVGDVFPLKPAVHVFLAALRPGVGGAGFAWPDLAVLAMWTIVGLGVAVRMPWYERS
jgi:ABC-type multidrug transport system permease subunit